MSQLTSDNKNAQANSGRRFSFLIPPQEEKMTVESSTTPLAQRGMEYIREHVKRLPLDLSSDADAARDKALSDSVRAGFVDDVGVEENRRIFNIKKRD